MGSLLSLLFRGKKKKKRFWKIKKKNCKIKKANPAQDKICRSPHSSFFWGGKCSFFLKGANLFDSLIGCCAMGVFCKMKKTKTKKKRNAKQRFFVVKDKKNNLRTHIFTKSTTIQVKKKPISKRKEEGWVGCGSQQ